MATARRRFTCRRPPVDKLGTLVLLRDMLRVVPGLSDDNRAPLMRVPDIATLDLHPRPLPVWLWSYQLMTEPRRRQVDAFVARQAKVDQTERQRMLGRKKA